MTIEKDIEKMQEALKEMRKEQERTVIKVMVAADKKVKKVTNFAD